LSFPENFSVISPALNEKFVRNYKGGVQRLCITVTLNLLTFKIVFNNIAKSITGMNSTTLGFAVKD